MGTWNDGYVSEIPYTFGYYSELNPNRVVFSLLAAGFHPPRIETACELGFGQGISLSIHAAATNTEWWGTDFNPSHAATAASLLRSAKSSSRVCDQSFEEFGARGDLPQFDFVGLHGVWSWISDENRDQIVRFIRRNLRVGGVVYTSYNTFPGWTSFYPVRHLLTQHQKSFGSAGKGLLAGIQDALDFTSEFMKVGSAYLETSPDVSKKLGKVTAQNRRYLAHEYFNEDWHPMFFADIAEALMKCKLEFACSAGGGGITGDLTLSVKQRQMLDAIPDRIFQQTVRDFMVNEQFRRDYWIRGARKINPEAQRSRLREFSIILCRDPRDGVTDGRVLGGIRMNPDFFYPLVDLLLARKPCPIKEIEDLTASTRMPFHTLIDAISILLSRGFIEIVQQDQDDDALRKRTGSLNDHILNEAKGTGELSFLASPVTGGGVFLSRFKQLYLNAMRGDRSLQKRAWAGQTDSLLRSMGQLVVKDGSALQSQAVAVEELIKIAEDFDTHDRPLLSSLGVF